jgi:hypothetical protein
MSPREVSSSALMESLQALLWSADLVVFDRCAQVSRQNWTKVEVGGSTELGPISVCMAGELTLVQLGSFFELLTLSCLFLLFFLLFSSYSFLLTLFFLLISLFLLSIFLFFFSLPTQISLRL